jgi:hypothetical protein
VAISGAVSGVWHRRQFFVATPTTIEVVFVDGGVDPNEEEKRRKKKQEEEVCFVWLAVPLMIGLE